MNNEVLRGIPAHNATGPGGSAPGVRTPEAASCAADVSQRAVPLPVPTPVFEALEDRRLMSSVSLSNGVLTLSGNSNSPNDLIVQPSGSRNLYAYANDARKTVALSSVRLVKFVGGSKVDDIFLASTLNIDAEVRAGGGNDSVRLGVGDDYVDAGEGDDRIWTRAGNDKAVGGGGNDVFKGDEGNDTFDGGAGSDNGDGGPGNDTVAGGDGNDTLIGNTGDDRLEGGDGNDFLRADAGNDKMYGGDDDDKLRGGSGADFFDGQAGKNVYEDLESEDKVPAGSSHGTPGGGNGSSDGEVPAGISDNEATVVGRASDSDSPRPVINLIGKTGTAPHTVHVHALASTLDAGSYLTARWQWDFGDSGGKYNTLEGWNAAHLYTEPGEYAIKLTVTNENGKSSTLTTKIRVVGDERRAIHVDAERGNDNNNGATQSTAVKTPERAKELLGNHTRLLFKRDQRHVFDFSLAVPYQDVYIGAYGSGDRPVLWRVRGAGSSTISLYNQSNQVTIENLVFDSPYSAGATSSAGGIGVDGIVARGVNITVRGSEFRNLDDAIDANGDPRGLLVQDNTAPLATGLRNYFVWSEGSDQVFLGNTVANSTREHNIRSSGTKRMLVAYNDLTNLDRSRYDEPDYSKGTVEIHKGSFAYVWRNELHDGALRAGPLDPEATSVKTEWVVFDSNELFEHDLTVKVGTHHLMARNNIIRTNTSAAITVETADSRGRSVSDLHFVNNTAVASLGKGRFINVLRKGTEGAITLKNNLWIAPKFAAGANASAPVFVEGSDLDVFKEISNNVWPKPVSYTRYSEGGIHYVWPSWSDSRGFKDVEEWDDYAQVKNEQYENTALASNLAPRSGTIAAKAGVAVKGVFADFYGRTRPRSGAVSAGAVQA
jgi:PKD repeat protein